MKQETKTDYERYLNKTLGAPEQDLKSNGGRISDKYKNRYGSWLRIKDPIAFNVGYNEYLRSEG